MSKKHHDHEEHEEHVNHEAWVIPYADMLTLLMALFLVLFAIGRTDAAKFKALAGSLRASITGITSNNGAPVVVPAGGGGTDSVLNGLDAVVSNFAAAAKQQEQVLKQVIKQQRVQQQQAVDAAVQNLTGVQSTVQQQAALQGIGDKIQFRMEGRGLVVSIVTDQVVFGDGAANLQPEGAQILDVIAAALKSTTYDLAIEGHTDSRPISTARFPSNWELSTARATTVLRYLIDQAGFAPTRLTASGYADTRPIAPGNSQADNARNRRVEIVVLSNIDLTSPGTSTTDTIPTVNG